MRAVALLCLLSLSGCPHDDDAPNDATQRDGGAHSEPNMPPNEGTEPSDHTPPEATGGQTGEGGGGLDTCNAEHWASKDQPRTEARCMEVYRQSVSVPRNFRCSCDLAVCPEEESRTPVDPRGAHDAWSEACLIPVEAETCADALQSACDTTVGKHGFCEFYSVLDHNVGILCFERPDGGHVCECPHLDQPTETDEPNCELARIEACAAECETDAGRCVPQGNGYDCQCAIGITGHIEDPLCEDALHYWCEPACENAAGACYWQPDGERIVCKCEGDDELHIMAPDPNVQGDECQFPLITFCGE